VVLHGLERVRNLRISSIQIKNKYYRSYGLFEAKITDGGMRETGHLE
jgi:hypothetical protein